MSDIIDLTFPETDLSGKADVDHNHDSTYAVLSHKHEISEANGLQEALDKISEYEASISKDTPTVSKTCSAEWGNYLAFMKLIPNQVNTFEGVITVDLIAGTVAEAGILGDTTYKIFVKRIAYGDTIVNPIIYTTEFSNENFYDKGFTAFYKISHNDSGDILLAVMHEMQIASWDSQTMIIEGTTNSPTYYNLLTEDDFIGKDIDESTKY